MVKMVATLFTVLSVQAVVVDKRVTIQPIRVGSTDGSSFATVNFYEEETDKVWSQAGIDFEFLATKDFKNSTFLTVVPSTGISPANTFLKLIDAVSTAGLLSTDPTVVNVIFVPVFTDAARGYSPGLGYAGVANSANILTLAHEVGHTLIELGNGGHSSYDASSDPFPNLMVSTSVSSISDIYPHGQDRGHLTQAQIDKARLSSYATDITPYEYNSVPEPRSIGVGAGLLLSAFALVRRRNRKSQSYPICR